VRRALERVGEQISGILQRAHETAEQITAQSRSEAEDRLEQARIEAAQVAEDAEERVKDLDADTDRIWLERQRIVADAEDLAGQLLALARTAAERFPADAETETEAEADADPESTGGTVADDDSETEPYTAIAEEPDEPDEPDDRSEIERTVAFQPLDDDAEPEASDERLDDADADRHAAGDDDTAVIPPASQAANRRQQQ
jgi:hypothetical protein